MKASNDWAFAILTDTHIRLPQGKGPESYPSNSLANARCRHAVRAISAASPAFAVHLGDVQHTIPARTGYAESVAVAKGILSGFDCPLHMTPGNHDVGDKPEARAGAPAVHPEYLRAYERQWGSSFYSFDRGGCHFVVLNAQVMNSGLDSEREQRGWLEGDLDQARSGGLRIFLFSHYAPFLTDPGEDEHYDNIGEPARAWLLRLLQRYGVEAVFCGHTHHFFYNRYGSTRIYVVPSVSFVRPDVSEMFAVGPADEYGRNDLPKLGFVLVTVGSEGHSIEFIRTHGTGDDGELPDLSCAPIGLPRLPVGVYLRRACMQTVHAPYGNLDEFGRKLLRNDYPLLALLGAGIRAVRIPLADLRKPAVCARMTHLGDEGIRVTVFSTGVPGAAERSIVCANRHIVHWWELCATAEELGAALAAVDGMPIRAVLSGRGRCVEGVGKSREFSHFARHGFTPGDAGLVARSLGNALSSAAVGGIAFHLGPEVEPSRGLAAARAIARRWGLCAIVHLHLRGARQAVANDDDAAIAERVACAVDAVRGTDGVELLIDCLEDRDRGYYPHHGLIDRRGNPRPAWRALRARWLAGA